MSQVFQDMLIAGFGIEKTSLPAAMGSILKARRVNALARSYPGDAGKYQNISP